MNTFIESLKVGDKVALKKSDCFGIKRYYYYKYETIEHISPKRNKITTDWDTYTPNTFYRIEPITSETDRINEIFNKRLRVVNLIYTLTSDSKTSLEPDKMTEPELDFVREKLESIAVLMKKKTEV